MGSKSSAVYPYGEQCGNTLSITEGVFFCEAI
nr:MAG TPA: hypothetical protein [Caudoviricetes sp.]